MIKKIKELAPFEITSIQFVKKDGQNFLEIELPNKDLKSIEEKSKIISNIIDEIGIDEENFFLNVFSSGTEKEIKPENINLFLNQYVYIKTNKHYLIQNEWEGDLMENGNGFIVIKVNNKGRFQKLKIQKENILYIKTTAKIRKE